MKNLKVSRKLTISYGFILSLLVISIVVSIGNLISIRSKVEVFYNGPFRVLNAANTVNSSFEAMQKSVFRVISSTSQANTEQALENARAWERKIQEQIPVIQKDFLGDQAIVERLQAALIEIADRKADELIVNLHAMQTKFITILSVLGIASVLVSVFFGIYITRGITRPIKELEAAARQMEQGHLKIDVNYASKDELGSLSDSMRQMSDKISYYMDAISRVCGSWLTAIWKYRTMTISRGIFCLYRNRC